MDWVAAAWGYLHAVVIGQPVRGHFARFMRAARGKSASERRDDRASTGEFFHAGLGIVERSVYVTAFLLNAVVFVLAWLVFKAVSKWRDWSNHRGLFNGFAIGTVLSLFFGVGGAALAYGMTIGDYGVQAAAALGPLLLTALVWWVHRGPPWMPTSLKEFIDPSDPPGDKVKGGSGG